LIIVEPERQGKYIVAVDPLDGASNIGCLASIGTIFGIFKKTTEGPVTEADVLQSGRQMLAAGYALYGSATSVVISTGNGVNSYLLDPFFIIDKVPYHLEGKRNFTLYLGSLGNFRKVENERKSSDLIRSRPLEKRSCENCKRPTAKFWIRATFGYLSVM
uniref:Fructose-1-6-bisphosphatase class I N-terminal domain-containing protein n=1 Tax=Parascaris equorum TaxID=6256 RepID=A0A914RJX8_PAREQ